MLGCMKLSFKLSADHSLHSPVIGPIARTNRRNKSINIQQVSSKCIFDISRLMIRFNADLDQVLRWIRIGTAECNHNVPSHTNGDVSYKPVILFNCLDGRYKIT
jgi:hypothetical protein